VLDLRTEEEAVRVRRGDVRLVVRGAIRREYRPSFTRKKIDTARLEEGYRVHLHRRSEARPVEIDASNFEFGFAVTGSARLELDAWVDEVAAGASRDDGFRHLPPALGPAVEEPMGLLAAASYLGARSCPPHGGPAPGGSAAGRTDQPLLLDNAAQFRFYSAWRGAFERRRAAGARVDGETPGE
jgi:hypothetical protein